MYADIKSTNQILINRLTDTERILLEEIVDNAGTITFSKLTGETGDFDGILINIAEAEEEEE